MNKVCHLTSVHDRYDGRILEKECVSLANAGYDVTLIVADNKEDEVYKNVKITSINFHPKNRLDRILHSKEQMLKKALAVNAEIYHFHDPELIPVGVTLHERGKKVIYDSHEDYVQDIKEKEWLPYLIRLIVSFLFKHYEKNCIRKFDAIVTVTPHVVKRFMEYHNNVHMVTNYPSIISKENINYNGNKDNQICFTGLVSPLWKHKEVITAINTIKEDINYVIAGPAKDDYLKALKKLDISCKMKYIGCISSSDVATVQRNSLAGMAILKYSPSVGGKIGTLGNTKIFEYMSNGIPVICTGFVLWQEIVDKWKCGVCVSPDNVKEIAGAISFIKQNPDQALIMGQNGRNAVFEEYNWSTQETRLLALYRNLIE